MLNYTFSKREKFMILGLVVVLIGVLWYRFVFVATQDEISKIDTQISETQSQMVLDQSMLVQQQKMQDDIAKFKSSGMTATEMPAFDNTQPLMAELNGILSAASEYTLKFEDVNDPKSSSSKSSSSSSSSSSTSASSEKSASSSSNVVERGVSLTYGCSSYQEARVILNSLVHGRFPCSIDDFSLTDKTVNLSTGSNAGSGSSSSAPYTAAVHLTFYENGSAATKKEESTDGEKSAATNLAENMGMVTDPALVGK
jgi:hypothetical protein